MELDIAARAQTFGGCATSTGAASPCKRSQRKSAERSQEWSSFLGPETERRTASFLRTVSAKLTEAAAKLEARRK